MTMRAEETMQAQIARIEPQVHWDRGVVQDDAIALYGWIDREDGSGKSDIVLLFFGRSTGKVTWWFTSSAQWSEHIHELYADKHNACVPFEQAVAAFT